MAGLSCGASCAKYILFFFNFVFFLVGAVLLGVGIYVKVDSNTNDLLDVLKLAGEDELLHTAAIMVIVVGALIFLVGFFGCCGACQESTCMLFIYAFLVAVILILQIVCAIMAAVFKGKLSDEIRDEMADNVKNEVTADPADAATSSWWSMQHSLKCCGSNGPIDYKNSRFGNESTTGDIVPGTCCKLSNDNWRQPEPVDNDQCQDEARTIFNNPQSTAETTQLYSDGCYYEMKDYLESKAIILIGIAIGLAVVEIVGIILACCLRKEIATGEQTV